jgi:hypothetical protein
MPGPETQDQNIDLDIDSVSAEISADLFGPGSDDDVGKEEGGEGAPDAELVEPPLSDDPDKAKGGDPTSAVVEEPKPEDSNSEAVRALGAPETWTKDAIAEWAKTPPRVQQEILKREEDMHRGLEQYKERADLGTRYDKVVEPYRPILAAENIDPVELFNSFAGNHYLLTRGTPEQKIDLAANLLTSYGIDPAAVAAKLANYVPPSPETLAIQQRLDAADKREADRIARENETRMATFAREVDAFASDPANIYFEEVGNDIAALLKSGQATDLKSAYDKAVYLNPVTRQKEIDRMTAEKISETEKERQERLAAAQKATGANVKTSSKTRDGTIPVGTMDETIDETMRKIEARG